MAGLLNSYQVDPAAPRPIEDGNINIYTRPIWHGEDGQWGTVGSMNFEEDGFSVLVPTIVDGKKLLDEDAYLTYKATGKHLGKFKSSDDAALYGEALHNQQQQYYGDLIKGARMPFIDEEAEKYKLSTQARLSSNTDLFLSPTGVSRQEELNRDKPGLALAAFREMNLMYDLVTSAERMGILPDGKTFEKDFKAQLMEKGVPVEQHERFWYAQSQAEFDSLMADLDRGRQDAQVLQDAGLAGTAAGFVAALADPTVIIPGTAITRGLGVGARSAGMAMAVPALQGAGFGLAYGTAESVLDPDGTAKDALYGMMGGAVFGAALGAIPAVGRMAANKAEAATAAREAAALEKAQQEARRAAVQGIQEFDEAYRTPDKNPGVEALNRPAVPESQNFHGDITDIRAKAAELAASTPINAPTTMLSKLGSTIANLPYIKSLANTLYDFGGPVSKMAATQLFESAEGRWRTPRSAALLDDNYTARIMTPIAKAYDKAYAAYRARNGISLWKGYESKNKGDFDWAVIQELEHRRMNGVETAGIPEDIRRMADAYEAAGKEALNIGLGGPGEVPVRGFNGIDPEVRGYTPLSHMGQKVVQTVKKYGRDGALDWLRGAYKSANPEWDAGTIDLVSKAVLRRSLGKAKDMNTDLYAYMGNDPAHYQRQMLLDHGVDEETVDQLVYVMMKRYDEMGKPGYTKHRTPIDINYVSDKGLTAKDFIDTDLFSTWSRYSRSVSGRAALARHGIDTDGKLESIISEIVEEMGGRITRDQVSDMFTHFKAGPIAGGVSETTRRAALATRLSLLGKLGITQFAETGALVASIGVKRIMRNVPGFRSMVTKEGKALAEQLEPYTGSLWDEHNLYRPELGHEFARNTSGAHPGFLQTIDRMLANGQRIQSTISGFYKLKSWQLKTAMEGMTDKVLSEISTGDFRNLARYEDMGFSQDLLKRIKADYIDGGVVQFNERGITQDLGLGDWAARDAEEFALAIRRFTAQVVQRSLAGETNMFMHGEVGTVLMQLANFPIQAISKSFTRNMRFMDNETAMLFLYGMGTASMSYVVRNAVSGNFEHMSPGDIARGAWNYANVTGWSGMVFDPVFSMAGFGNPIGGYGTYGSDGLFSLPPILSTANRWANIPAALVHGATGQLGPSDTYALTATPLIGSLAGVGALLKSLEDDDDGE